MLFCDFDLIRPRENAFWQFEQCLIVQKSPILAVVPLTRIITICEMAKMFIFASEHNGVLVYLECYCLAPVYILCYESMEFYLAKRWLLWWQYNPFNFV